LQRHEGPSSASAGRKAKPKLGPVDWTDDEAGANALLPLSTLPSAANDALNRLAGQKCGKGGPLSADSQPGRKARVHVLAARRLISVHHQAQNGVEVFFPWLRECLPLLGGGPTGSSSRMAVLLDNMRNAPDFLSPFRRNLPSLELLARANPWLGDTARMASCDGLRPLVLWRISAFRCFHSGVVRWGEVTTRQALKDYCRKSPLWLRYEVQVLTMFRRTSGCKQVVWTSHRLRYSERRFGLQARLANAESDGQTLRTWRRQVRTVAPGR
jgi:hypothetical protein